MFLRFAARTRHVDSRVGDGIFGVAYRVRDEGDLESYERAYLLDCLNWFEEHLPAPESRRIPDAAVFWLKHRADEHIARMWELYWLLDHIGEDLFLMTTRRPGYVYYEDDLQVAAEPRYWLARFLN